MSPGVVLPGQVTLWCCSGCGKWSHAKRRPAWHKRLIRGLDPDETAHADEDGWIPDDSRRDGRSRCGAQEQAADWELPVIEVHEAYGGQGVVTNVHGDPEPEPWWEPEAVTVKCGPFVEYTARLRAQWHEDATAKRHAERLSAEAGDDTRPSLVASHLPFGGDGQDIPAF